VNDVVEIAQTSHGTFYLYFSNKEDLLRALVAEAAAEAGGLYAAIADPPGGTGAPDWDTLREWVERYSSMWKRYAPLLRAWTELANVDPELGEQTRRSIGSMSDALSARIASTEAGAGLDTDVAGMAILAMLDRFHYFREFVGQPVDSTALDTLTTIVHRALFAAPARSRGGPSSARR
jgi:AcrR family transcriptional regulator